MLHMAKSLFEYESEILICLVVYLFFECVSIFGFIVLPNISFFM